MLNFSIPSLFLYGLLLSFWFFFILANYFFQVSFNLTDNFAHCQHNPKYHDWVPFPRATTICPAESVSSGVREVLLSSPGQTIATCQRNISQHRWARHVECYWLKFDHFQTWANNTQHVATRRHRVAKRAQHVAPNNAAICCDRLARALKWKTITQRQSEVLTAGTFNNIAPTFWTVNLNNFVPPLSVLLYLFALTLLGPRVHVLKCGTAGNPLWETVIMSPGIALAGNRWVSVTCIRLSVSTVFTQYQQFFLLFK